MKQQVRGSPVWHSSPNFGPRRGGATPDIVLLHHTAMATAEAALERLCDPAAEVSAHYLIARDGRLWQMVREADRAWHAGAGAWGPVTDVNSRSIGIEIDNDGQAPFSEPALLALEALLPGIMGRWAIPKQRVIGHSDMAPGRKLDPGAKFDWLRLERQGLACPRPDLGSGGGGEADARDLDRVLRSVGYTAGGTAEARLAAFRLRFRPGGSGPARQADLEAARWLARHYPVDPAPARE